VTASFSISPRDDRQDIPAQDAQQVSAMRRLAKARLDYCGLSLLIDDVELLVSELVTNAIQHSRGTEITMTLRLDRGVLRLDVTDRTHRRPHVQRTTEDAESGRGLQLVQWITEQNHGAWGVSSDGTNTWCAIPTLV
jgi:anti-sigma regulatory factor (Ser/Thr protein kinase)